MCWVGVESGDLAVLSLTCYHYQATPSFDTAVKHKAYDCYSTCTADSTGLLRVLPCSPRYQRTSLEWSRSVQVFQSTSHHSVICQPLLRITYMSPGRLRSDVWVLLPWLTGKLVKYVGPVLTRCRTIQLELNFASTMSELEFWPFQLKFGVSIAPTVVMFTPVLFFQCLLVFELEAYASFTYTLCPEKNIPNIIDCHLKKGYPVIIIFGISGTAGQKTTIQYFTSHNVCFCPTWGKQNQRNMS